MSQMIPVKLDVDVILSDLRSAGWLDQKIETACGMSNGYVAQLRGGHIGRMSYEFGARLYNLWADEQERANLAHLPALTLDATTS